MLDGYLRTVGAKAFAWGTHDCTTFVCGWIKYATGQDILAQMPPWHDQRSALRVQQHMGGLEGGVIKFLGVPRLVGSRTGDVVLLDEPHNCLGILNTNRVLVVTSGGLNCIDPSFAKFIWEVR